MGSDIARPEDAGNRNGMKKTLTLFVLMLVIACCQKHKEPELSPADRAIMYCSQHYEIPSALLYGIRHAESLDGKWLWSDSFRVVSKQKWIRNLPIKKLFGQYGRSVFWCVGDFQVLYLSAYSAGYRGSPTELGMNIDTNCKYASIILRHYIYDVPGGDYMRNAIANYNSGNAQLNEYGDYRNEKYVNEVYFEYLKRGGE